MSDNSRDRRDNRDGRDRDSRDSRDRDSRDRGGRDRTRRRRIGRNEYCPKGKCFDYKDVGALNKNVNEVGKIRPRRQTGNCARCQRELAREIKRARFLALMPYIANTD